MRALHRMCLVAVGLALGLPLLAKDDDPDDVAADVPVRTEKDLFHPPVRLATATG